MRAPVLFLLVLLVPAVVAAPACNRRVCGPGTLNIDGVCVPSLECGPGTAADGGTCHPEVTCGEGTFADDGECVPLPPLALDVDVEETAEPNDPFAGGPLALFELPEVGEDGVTVGGNVALPEAGAGDLDGFLFQTSGARLIRFTGFSRGAASVAFVVQGWEPGVNDAFLRYGLHTGGMHASREVMIPTAGEYALIVSETVNVLALLGAGGTPFGGPSDDYGVLVEAVELPEVDDLAVPDERPGMLLGGGLHFFRVEAMPGAMLAFAVIADDPTFQPVVLAFDAQSLAALGSLQGVSTGSVPLDAAILLVQDFVSGSGIDKGYTLGIDLVP